MTIDHPADAMLATETAGLLLTTGVLDDVVKAKRLAHEILRFTRRERLSRDAVLDAAEMVRRAERAVGLAIRRGQRAGEIETLHEAVVRATRTRHGRQAPQKPRVLDYLTQPERSSSNGDVFDLTDGITDEQFEAGIAEARADRNLSRTNLVRRLRGGGQKPSTRRPEHLRGLRHLDGNRIIDRTILDSGIDRELADQIDYRELDRARLEEWVSSLSGVIRSLTKLKRELKKELNHGQG